MSITFQFIEEHGLLIARHEGTINDRELINEYKGIFLDPRYATRSKTLIDLSNANSENRSVDGIKKFSELIADYRKKWPTSAKIAIIAPSDLAFGLSRIFEAFSSDEPAEVMIGRNIDEILDFLDLTAEDLGEC